MAEATWGFEDVLRIDWLNLLSSFSGKVEYCRCEYTLRDFGDNQVVMLPRPRECHASPRAIHMKKDPIPSLRKDSAYAS